MNTVFERIKFARENFSNLSQEGLAEKLNVHPVSISRWETGDRNPSFKDLRKISEVFNKPIAWFFLEDGQRIENGEKTVTPEEALAVIAELVDQSDTKPIAIPVKRRAVEKMRSHRNERSKGKADEA